jgi:hypothetical protein
MDQRRAGRLQVTGYRLQVTGYRLQVTGYRLQVTGYRLTERQQKNESNMTLLCEILQRHKATLHGPFHTPKLQKTKSTKPNRAT